VLADQRIARQLHRPQVERAADVPCGPCQLRHLRRALEHVVAVVAPLGTEAGVEVGGVGPADVADGDLGAAQPVEPAPKTLEVGVVGKVEAHHLTPGVDACVGPASADRLDGMSHHGFDGGAQVAHHGADGFGTRTRRLGEPVEPRAVIRNGQPGTPHGSSLWADRCLPRAVRVAACSEC
jgi:hypothetical protein